MTTAILNTEFVTYRQWDSYAMRVEKANIKREGRSLTAGGIANRARFWIVEIQDDKKGMIVAKNWREAMKTEIAAAKPGFNAEHWLIDGDKHSPAFETPEAANRWSKATKGFKEPIQACHCGDFHSHRDDT